MFTLRILYYHFVGVAPLVPPTSIEGSSKTLGAHSWEGVIWKSTSEGVYKMLLLEVGGWWAPL